MMGLIEKAREFFVPTPAQISPQIMGEVVGNHYRAVGQRYFAAAHLNRSTSFNTFPTAYNREIHMNLAALRLHSRDLVQNNPYARNYVELCATHIVGAEGVVLESKVEGYKGPRQDINRRIEKAWELWSRSVTCDGRLSLVEVEQQVATAVARDGECFIVKHLGFRANPFGFALEILDATQVDWMYEVPADANGVRTEMGIQHDQWGRPMGYWVFTSDPMDYTGRPVRKFIPADQVIHVYREDRVRGVRGIPWMTASMPTLNMLGQLLNAELAAAIAGANQFGVIEGAFEDDSEGPGDYATGEDPRDTAQTMISEECSFLGVAPGQKVSFPPLMHPNPHLGGFMTTLLHAIAASNQVAYHSLTGDVSEANYSSARVALLNERDCWKRLQKLFVKSFMDPVFSAWLKMAVISGQLSLPMNDLDAACKPHWWARSWDWIDPKGDAEASILAIRSGLSTHAEELGQLGRNWRRTMEQLAVEQAYARDLNVHIEMDFAKGGNSAPSDLSDPSSVQNPDESAAPAKAPAKPAPGGKDA